MNIVFMKVYDEYEEHQTTNILKDFVEKTFPKGGTNKLFIGVELILITSVCKSKLSSNYYMQSWS
jgi:hypothetical protein